jgi:hypothetical protein
MSAIQEHSRFELSVASDQDSGSGDNDFSSSRHHELAHKSKEASKRRLEAKAHGASQAEDKSHAHPKVLSSSQRDQIRDKIKRFESDIDSDDKKAASIDKKIQKKSSALKELLLKAKHIRSEGDSLEDEAKQVQSRLAASHALTSKRNPSDCR